MSVLRTIRRTADTFEGPTSTIFLVVLLILSALAPAAAQPSSPSNSPAATTPAVNDMLDHLRDRDQVLERIARRMAHPQGAPVDGDELHRFVESLERLEMWIAPLAEDHPELVTKHHALVARARQLANASGRSRAANSDLVASDESIRRLQVDGEAFVAAVSSLSDAARVSCESAPTIGVETRALAGVDGTRDALVRFVAPSDGRFLVDTAGSRTDTRLQVLTGCGGPTPAVLAVSDDESSLRARTQVSLRRGEEVWIRVGADREGGVRLSVEQLTEGIGTSSIMGTVTSQASGIPIESLSLRAESDSFGTYYSSTNSSGEFQFTGLPAGTYEVYTRDFDFEWINEIWDNIECGLGSFACSGVVGDPIVVAEGQTVESVDFTLGRPSVLSGRVTDAATGDPVAGAEIRLATASSSVRTTSTDEQGRFRLSGILPGTYFLKASAFFHEDELFDDVACPMDCDVTTGTPIVVMADLPVAGLDFALDRTGGIIGSVTSQVDGGSLGLVPLRVYDEDGMVVAYGESEFDGSFFLPLHPGTYFMRTYSYSFEYVDQMWQGIDCLGGCDLGMATPIVLAENEVAEVTFELLQLGIVEGEVTAADSGQLSGHHNTQVEIYDANGDFVGSDSIYEGGSYQVDRLLAGDHFAVASDPDFRSEVYDDLPCAAGNVCDPLTGTPIPVVHNTTISGIDFALERLGIITGVVTRSGTTVPASGIEVVAQEFPGSFQGRDGASVSAYTDENGEFRLEGLEPGSYAVFTSSDAYLDEAFDDVPCENGCDLSTGDAVVVPAVASVVGGIDFSLVRKAWIEGSVAAAADGTPISAGVALYRSDGSLETSRSNDSTTGEFLFEGLEDGSYYVVTNVYADQYVNEIFDDVPCDLPANGPTCEFSTGNQIPVAVGSGALVEFELDVGGAIEGTMQDEFGNLVSGRVSAFDLAGNYVDYDSASSNGEYRIEGLQAGDYYLVTSFTDHADELWPNTPCLGEPVPNCTLTDGTPVGVTLGTTAPGIDFVLGELATISGVVVDSESGLPTLVSDVRLYDATGSWIDTSYTHPFELTEIPPGTYYLATYGSPNHLEGIYGGGICDASCDPTTGTPIMVDAGDVVSGVEIQLQMGPGIQGRVLDGPTGVPLAGVSIDIWNGLGEHEDSAVTNEDGWYRLPGVYGTYYVSTYNDLGFEDFLYDGIPCPDGSAWEGLCDPTEGTPYVIEEYQPLQRLDLPFGDPTVFTDGFESGDTTAWSQTVGD